MYEHRTNDDVSRVFLTARRRLPGIAAWSVLAAVIAFWASGLLPDTYQANASLVVDARSSTALEEQQVLALPSDGTSRAFLTKTESDIVGSLPVIEAAVARLTPEERRVLLDPDGEDGADSGPLTREELRSYRRLVTVTGEPNTFLVRIIALAPTAELAAKVANNHAAAYFDLDVEHKRGEANRILSLIRTEYDLLEADKASAQRQIVAIQAEGLPSTSTQSGVAATRLAQLYQTIETVRVDMDSRRIAIATAEATGDMTQLEDSSRPVSDLNDLVVRIDRDIAPLTEGSRARSQLVEQRGVISAANVRAAETLLLRKKSELEIVEQHLASLTETAVDLERRIEQGQVLSDQLDRLRDQLRMASDRQAVLAGRRAQIEGQIGVIAPDARIVDPASPPARRRSPQPALASALAFSVVFAGALGVALRSGRGVARARNGSLPLLGILPAHPGRSAIAQDQEGPDRREARESMASAIRNRIDATAFDTGARRFVICGIETGPELSDVTDMLAQSFTRAGFRTLVVCGWQQGRINTRESEDVQITTFESLITEARGSSLSKALATAVRGFDRVLIEVLDLSNDALRVPALRVADGAIFVQSGRSVRPEALETARRLLADEIAEEAILGVVVAEPGPQPVRSLRLAEMDV